VELIAFDFCSPIDYLQVYGAVSIGNIWQFVILERELKQITQNLNLYCVPTDVDILMKVLVGMVKDLPTK
jgi:hypothetical protein